MLNFNKKFITFVRNKIFEYFFKFNTKLNLKKTTTNFDDFKIGIKKNNNELIELRFNDGYKIICKNKDLNCVAETCINNDYLKNKIIQIKKNDIVFDIGAHIGSFSILAANKGATVYAFEPEKNNYLLLLKNIKINNLENKIIPFDFGVYSQNQELKLYESSNTGGHSIINNSNQFNQKYQLIKLKTLENICKELKIDHIDLLKIDIEGSEYDLFKNLTNEIYKKIKIVIGEYHLFYNNDKLNYGFLKKILSKNYQIVKKYSPYYFIAYNKTDE